MMDFDGLLVMSMALIPGVLATGVWRLVTRRDDELRDCVARAPIFPGV